MVRAPLILRPWAPGDEDAFTPRPDFARERAMGLWDWRGGPPGPTVTIERGGAVVGVGGFLVHRGPVQVESLEAWAWLADLPRRDWPVLLALAGMLIEQTAASFGARLVTAMARRDFPGAVRCLERLGFRDDYDVMVDHAAAYRYFIRVFR